MSRNPSSGAWVRPIHPATFLWTHPPERWQAGRSASACRAAMGLGVVGVTLFTMLTLAIFWSAQPDSMREHAVTAIAGVP